MLSPSLGCATIFTYTITTAQHGIQVGLVYSFYVVAINDKGSSLPSLPITYIMAA